MNLNSYTTIEGSSQILPIEDILPNQNVQLSSSFSENTSDSELKYFLSNILSDEDVADLEAKYTPNICEYCSKENLQSSSLSCCEKQELDKYIKDVESKQIEDRISTYFLLRPRRINSVSQAEIEEMKRFVMKENYRRGMNIEASSSTVVNAGEINRGDEPTLEIKLNRGSTKTFRRIKKKMDKFKMFWPQLFDSQLDPINVWGNMTEDLKFGKKINIVEGVGEVNKENTVGDNSILNLL